MIPPLIHTCVRDGVWPSATEESDELKNVAEPQLDSRHPFQASEPEAGSCLSTQPLRPNGQNHNGQPRVDKIEPANTPRQPHDAQGPAFSHDPYLGLPVIGNGLTGIVLKIGEGRAVKKAKQYQPGQLQDLEDVEYMNTINQQTLENEIQVFERFDSHEGIIPYFQTSQYGIELALAQGNLESYLETYPEREDSLKISWILSLINTFAYAHARKVFVDDIALRNILILGEQLKLSDFGQSILFPPEIDIISANENDLTVQIEILHLGWVLYSIASWRVHKYYFFGPENSDLHWPEPDSFPNVDDVPCGKIIKKCWRGEYASMNEVKDEAHQLLARH